MKPVTKKRLLGLFPRSKLIPLEIEGIKRAWDFMLETKAKGNIPFSIAYLQKTHSIGFKWIFPDMGGKFRTINITVSKHVSPDYYQVSQLMANFCADLIERLKHLSKTNETDFLETLIELKVETLSARKKYIEALAAADRNNLKSLQQLIRQALEETAAEL